MEAGWRGTRLNSTWASPPPIQHHEIVQTRQRWLPLLGERGRNRYRIWAGSGRWIYN